MDAETRAAIKKLASAIDGVAGMAAGCAAYIAAMENASFADRRKAVGVSRTFAPEGLTGDTGIPPARVAQAMIEQIATVARQMEQLKQRIDAPPRLPPQRDREDPTPAERAAEKAARAQEAAARKRA
ncbi:hypothetical protein [Salinarimonas rosea]|uniref:hypothetical protein n=1 Tax=Salinarimonas rosea TaxID=552063 RepID=UPI0004219890|nr:hypothetical protein [Salinarimonas rosea]